MPVDLNILLKSAQYAFNNDQLQHGMFLLNYSVKLGKEYTSSPGSSLDAAIRLDRGHVRKVNEDCVVALHGTLPGTGKVFGMFIICDGMGGHTNGQEAACMAVQVMTASIFPLLMNADAPSKDWRYVLVKGVEQANRAICQRNQWQATHGTHVNATTRAKGTPQISTMGTTITAVLLLGTTAYIANVGDSRTYLYAPETGLTRITRDHSIVAELLAQSMITEEEVYSHPRRNQITRYLGASTSIEVDSFVVSLPANAILLLCSDGLWEMTRDKKIAGILQLHWANAEHMAQHLLRLATEGGAQDNIGFVIVQPDGLTRSNDISNQITIRNGNYFGSLVERVGKSGRR
jgi:serine/threonine protein phosphatase PrpC